MSYVRFSLDVSSVRFCLFSHMAPLHMSKSRRNMPPTHAPLTTPFTSCFKTKFFLHFIYKIWTPWKSTSSGNQTTGKARTYKAGRSSTSSWVELLGSEETGGCRAAPYNPDPSVCVQRVKYTHTPAHQYHCCIPMTASLGHALPRPRPP